jgi:hypothetical protein
MSGLIQSGTVASANASTSVSVSIGGVTAGNQLLMYFSSNVSPASSGYPTTLSDGSNTWNLVFNTSDSPVNESFAVYWCASATVGSHTVTGTIGTSTTWSAQLQEWNGITAFDTGTVGTAATAGPVVYSTPSYTPGQANEVVFAIGTCGGETNPEYTYEPSSPPAGWSGPLGQFDGNTYNGLIFLWRIVTSTSTIGAVTFTSNSSTSQPGRGGIGGFKYTPSGGISLAWIRS